MILISAFAFLDLPGVCALQATSAESVQNEGYTFRGYGDSISAGYGLSDASNSYPQVFAQKYIDNFGGNFQPYGVSGDKSQDLVEDLQGYINKTASDYQDFYNTNYFVVCIGANNVLGPALENLSETEVNFRAILQESVDQFKSDYENTIIPCFTQNPQAKVIAMTVYNPYEYTKISDVVVNTGVDFFNNAIKTQLETFQKMLDISMKYLDDINTIIKNNASHNVEVVDINNLFKTFTKEQYTTYIDADFSKIQITSMDDINNIDSLIDEYADPHPTIEGHKIIANKHLSCCPITQLNMTTDLSNVINDNALVSLTATQVGGKTLNFKLYKEVSGQKTMLCENSSNIDSSFQDEVSFAVTAGDLIGEGILFAEGYDNSTLVLTTNKVDFAYEGEEIPTPVLPPEEEPSVPDTPNKPENSDTKDDDEEVLSENKTTIILVSSAGAMFILAMIIGLIKM